MIPQTGTAELNHLELAWAAGFFDGEGHISAKNNGSGRSFRLIMQIAQCNPAPLLRFRAAVGGLGIVVGPRLVRTNPRAQPVWLYRNRRFEQVQAATAFLWPYLCEPKRHDAERALLDMRSWFVEMNATCRKGIHQYAEVGRTSVGSCGECARVRQRQRAQRARDAARSTIVDPSVKP